MKRWAAIQVLVVALGVLFAAPASAEPWTKRALILEAGPLYGIRTNHMQSDPWRLGVGADVSFTFPLPFTVNAGMDYFAGDGDASFFQITWGWGYDLGLGPLVLRPTMRAGIGGDPNGDRVGLLLELGGCALVSLGGLSLDFDAQYEPAGVDPRTEAVILGLKLGLVLDTGGPVSQPHL